MWVIVQTGMSRLGVPNGLGRWVKGRYSSVCILYGQALEAVPIPCVSICVQRTWVNDFPQYLGTSAGLVHTIRYLLWSVVGRYIDRGTGIPLVRTGSWDRYYRYYDIAELPFPNYPDKTLRSSNYLIITIWPTYCDIRVAVSRQIIIIYMEKRLQAGSFD